MKLGLHSHSSPKRAGVGGSFPTRLRRSPLNVAAGYASLWLLAGRKNLSSTPARFRLEWLHWLLAAMLLLCPSPLKPAMAEAALPQVSWLTYTLEAAGIQDSPEHIGGYPEPVNERYVLITFKATDVKVSIFDLVNNVPLFSLEDSQGGVYVGAAYFPHSILFLSAQGVFSTAPEQTSFDILFVIPEDMPLEDLTLLVEESPGGKVDDVPVADIPLVSAGA